MICVYDIGNENFDKNGDAVLMPTSVVVKQVAGGNYDISIEHPIDAENKWAHLVPGAIVKAPVPKEIIENSFSGVEADVYKVNEPAQLREDTIAPHAITYDNWSRSPSENYEKGDKVTFDGENYEVQYYDGKSGETQIDPDKITWYKKIAKMTDGAPVLVSLNTGDELYYIEDANENWYKMSTFYGVVGYIPKAQVTYDRHVTPSESKPRIITDQLFRLQDPVIDNEKMTVKVTGQHVSYDLKGDLLKPISIYSAGPAMMMGIITGSLMYPYRGTVATNMSSEDHGTYTGEIKGKNGMFALLDPDKGLVSHFDAKFTRDNWDLFVLEKEDTDRGYKIRYGVNARGISWKKSSANLVTRVVPVAKDEKGEDLYLPEVWIDSEDINEYPVIMMEQIKVEGQVGKAKDASGDETWTEEDLLDEMREKAEERFSIDHADQIYQEVTIQIELVEDTDEYAWLKGLKDMLLYDIVTAVDERTGLDKKLYVSELEYDSVRERITGIKLTNIQDYDVRTVTGYNVKNNSIGLEKLTDEVTRGLVNQAVNIMPQYADPNAKRTADNLNTKTEDGIVLKGQGNANKVWGTDSQGNPGWVSGGGFDPNNLSESSTDPTDNDYTMQIGSTSYKLKFLRVWNYIKSKITGYTQSGKNYPVQADSNGKMYVNVPWEDTKYSLPLAASGTRGGVQIGYTQSGNNYPVQLSSEKMYVNVPWTDGLPYNGIASNTDTDFNNLTTVGRYRTRDATMTNAPDHYQWGEVIVFDYGQWVRSGGHFYIRNHTGSPATWGNWIDLTTNTWEAMTGATSSANGTKGYINATPPSNGYNTKFWRADGSWQVPPGTYSLPLAANGTRGGVQVGYTQSGKNYPVQLSNEKMYVNVPWTDESGNDKVAKNGDHMSAPLYLDMAEVDASKANNNVSSTLYPTTMSVQDVANRIIGRAEAVVQPDGRIGFNIYARNYNTSGSQTGMARILLYVDKNGDVGYEVDSPEAFRGAIELNVPRVNESSTHLPTNNTFAIREYESSSQYLPTEHFYHMLEIKGSDGRYGTQLAIGMTKTGVYYRRLHNNAWQSWEELSNNHQNVLSAASKSLLTIALDTSICPLNQVVWFDIRNSTAADVPTVYGVASVKKRSVNNPSICVYADSGAIYTNGYNGSSWAGWKSVNMTSV